MFHVKRALHRVLDQLSDGIPRGRPHRPDMLGRALAPRPGVGDQTSAGRYRPAASVPRRSRRSTISVTSRRLITSPLIVAVGIPMRASAHPNSMVFPG